MSSLAFRLLAAQQAAAANTNLYMWGSNTSGQLGTSANTYYSWSQINAGGSHTVAIRNDGLLFAWGNNASGQLGDGTTISKNSPIQIGYFSWNQITAGLAHTAGIRNDGTIWAWGGNQYYQLNDNTTIDKSYPILISAESWTNIAAGALHTIAIKKDGSLWSWGSDDSGQLGVKNSFVQLAVGVSHYAALKADGTMFTWGNNTSGELGNGTVVNQLVLTSPVTQVIGSWTQISATLNTTYGIKSNNTLWGWGDNTAGQLGDNTVINKSIPLQIAPAFSNIVQVVSGYDPNPNGSYMIYRNSDGQVWGTGYNGFNQLADSGGVNRSSPVQVYAVAKQDAVSVGTSHTIALATNGSLWAWGSNTSGQFGDGTTIDRSSPVQVNTNKWISIRAGFGVTHAIKSDYTLWGWGANGPGTLGQNDTIDRSSPVQIGGSWLAITAGNGYVMGIKLDGTLWTWGVNNVGQLGDGTLNSRSSPVQVGTSSWVAVESSSNGTSAAIRNDWLLFTWGLGTTGQLGDNTIVSKSSPVQVGTSSWAQVSVSANGNWMAALTTDWKLFTWGNNAQGQLGSATTVNRSSPVQVGTSSWYVVSAGTSHASAIDYSVTSRLFTWGGNSSGQLGDSTTTNRSSPVQVGTSTWLTVASKGRNTFGVRNDGTLWAWGANNTTYGFLGDNTTVDKSSPVQVLVGSVVRGASSIFAGGRMTGMLDYGNKAYLWGYNSNGQLGDGTTINRIWPGPMQIDKQWRYIAPTTFGGLGITTDGLLWGWGLNTFGEIGNNLPANPRSSPVQIGTSSWSFVSMNVGSPSTAIAADINNNVYGWGYNGNNLLGLGEATTISRSSPVFLGNFGSMQLLGLNTAQLSILQASGNFYVLGGAFAASQLGTSSPVQVPGFNPTYQSLTKVSSSSFTYVNAGKFHNAAITTDNKLFTWGNNYAGQLGDGTLINRSSPVQITGSWVDVHPGGTHTLGIRSDSSLYSWGKNTFGQLGLDDSSSVTWSKLHDGGSHLVAIRSDGAMFTWGQNSVGQLGDGTTTNRFSPVQIGTDSWVNVTAGLSHTLAIRSDSKLFAWGTNIYGQLGQGYNSVGVSWSQVVISTNFVIAIKNDGTLWSWGLGTSGQLGQGVSATISFPTQISNDSWLQVATGSAHSLALKQDGTMWAWGTNTAGQFGNLVVASVQSPILVAAIPYSISKIFAGFSTSAAISSNGYLYTWGGNASGVLGDGTTQNRSSPTQIGSSSWTTVSTSSHTLAIKADGTLWGWGLNSFGQLGNNTTVSRSSPVQIATGSWSAISAGSSVTAAIKTDGSLWTWGLGTNGVLGDGTTVTRSSPVQIGLSSWTNVGILGVGSMIATKVDGTVWMWGLNTSGQLGLRDVTARSSPVQIAASGPMQVLSTDLTPGYLLNGNLYLWGAGTNFVFGDGFSNNRSSPVQLAAYTNTSSPVQIGSDSWSQVAAGGYHTLAIKSDNSLYGWGLNNSGQLGGAPTVLNPVTWTTLKGNTTQTFGIRNDSTLWAWGTNANGQLGDMSVVSKSSPVLVIAPNTSFVTVASGDAHTLAITTDGRLFGWGKNDYGQAGALSWVQVATSNGSHVVAIRSDGGLFAWGNNANGQLGDNTTVTKSSPVAVTLQTGLAGAASWIQVSVGAAHTTALRSDYTLWAWGNNSAGQLGQNDTVNRSSPTQVGATTYYRNKFDGSTGYLTVPANAAWSFGTNDVTIECWISNTNTTQWTTVISRSSVIWGSGGWAFDLNGISSGSGEIGFWAWDGDPLAAIVSSSGVNVCDGLVHHIVYVRSGNTHSIFVDGIRRGTRTLAFSISNAMSAGGLWIGNDQFYPTRYLNGSISNLRIVVGTAVYDPTLTTLTVPTSPLTAITNTQLLTAQSSTVRDNSINNLTITTVGAVTVEQISPFSPNPFGYSFSMVSATQFTTFAITSDKRLFAWGFNGNTILGDNSTIDRSSPVQVAAGTSWVFVTGGVTHAAGIDNLGQLYTWGINGDGQLGQNDTISRSSPVQVFGGGSWLQVSAYTPLTSAIKTDGTLWVWGNNTTTNSLGLGLGVTGSRSSPTQVGTYNSWTSVSVGSNYIVANRYDNTIWAWGTNAQGQLGLSFISPTTVNGGSSYIRGDGRLFVWGRNDQGQLGLGDTISRSSPVQLGTDSWLMVKSTNSTSVQAFRAGIKTDGTLWTWGNNSYGQLGDGTNIFRSSPVQVAGSWINVAPGYNYTLALRDDYKLYAWGFNGQGSLGDGTSIDRNSPVLVSTNITSWSQISASTYNNLALTSDGKIYGWGMNFSGQILPTPLTFTQIGSALVLRSDGQLWMWGANIGGSLGDGTVANRSSPAQIPGIWKAATTAGQGTSVANSIAIRNNGTLWSWGNNAYGSLGDGTTISRSSPVQVGSDTDWLATATQNNSDAQFAIKTNNTLWTWGQNAYGVTGDSTTINRSSPVQIAGSWSQVISDSYNVFAIDMQSRLYTWGLNNYGQLGTNDTVNRSSPVQLPGSWTKVSTAYNSVAAIDTLGRLYTWGWAQNGRLGNSTTIDRSSPVQIGTSSWSVVGMTYGACAAITIDGKLFTWGGAGLLGDNSANSRSSPVQVGASSWTNVASGYFAQLAVNVNNTLYSWSSDGPRVGDNTTVAKNSPVLTASTNLNLSSVLVPSFSSPVLIDSGSWTAVSAGGSFSVAIKASDRSLWTWGLGANGVLGHGLTTSRSSPVQVGTLSWNTISSGSAHVAGITTTGGLFTWGYGFSGQLGSGATASRSAPVQVGASSWTIVSAGFDTAIGLDINNRLFTWGYNAYGDVGDNTTVNKNSPVLISALDTLIYVPTLVNTSSWTQVSAGFQTTHAITSDNRLWAWGLNTGGQIGDVSTVSRSSPVQVAAGTQSPARSSPVQIASGSWTSVAAGNSFSAAIRNDGTMFAWGINSSGQAGNSTTINRSYPTQLISSTSWSTVNAGADFIIAKDNTGKLFAWGNGWSGSLGNDNQGYRSSPVQIGNSSWTSVDVGSSHVVGLINNTLYSWGRNIEGQAATYSNVGWSSVQYLADGTTMIGLDMLGRLFAWGNLGAGAFGPGYQDNGTTARSRPVQIAIGQSFIALGSNQFGSPGTGGGGMFVIDNNDGLWAWGENTYGGLGDNTTIGRSSPVQIVTGQRWKKIVQGYNGSVLGLNFDGGLFGWGRNTNAQLGLGDLNSRSTPVQIPGNWIDVDTALYTSHGIKADGTLWGWGLNSVGDIGDNTIVQRNSPVQIMADKRFISVGHGYDAGFAISTTNDLYAWGSNQFGQLGNNETINRSSPVQIGLGIKWLSVKGGIPRSVAAITLNNTVYAWGDNSTGTLGLGDTIYRSQPTQITSLPSIKSIFSLVNSSSQNGLFFVDFNNRFWASGSGAIAMLGDGTTINRSTPVQITTGAVMSPIQIGTSSYSSISAGATHTAAVTTNGKLFVWGGNGSYQQGDGTSVNRSSPVQIGVGTSFVLAAAMGNVTFGGTSFGTYNVGENTAGQLGINTAVTTSALAQVSEPMAMLYTQPLRIGTSSWTQISAGASHSAAIKSDSTLWTWGNNATGALGDNTLASRSSPVQLFATGSWLVVSAGKDVTGAIQYNQRLYMWGNNSNGQLGDSTTVTKSSPVLIPGYWTDVEIAGSFVAAVNVNGTIWAWGNNTSGALGINPYNNVTLVQRSSPMQVGTGRYNYISVTENSLNAIDTLGDMYSWGDNQFGQLGVSNDYSWAILSTGQGHNMALRSDNTLWAWGTNTAGQLGINNTVNRSSPVQVGTNSWINVVAGGSHTVAVRPDYTVWTWGNNVNGGLGDGTTINRSSPTQISTGGASFVLLAASVSNTTVAVTNLGQLYGWGLNTSSQLGDGTTISKSSPTQIGTSSWTQVSAGGTHTLALDINNKLYAWGTGTSGQLGITSPTVTIGSDALSVAPNAYITSDGRLFVWGYNQYGQLGLGDTIGRSSPVQLGTSTDWYKIFKNVNIYQSLAVQKTDGSLWISGYNNNGQLGLGDTISRSSPVQLSAGAGLSWTQFAISQYQHAVGIKSDGTLWTMGSGTSGEIGDGNVVSRSSPVQVPGSWITCAAGTGFTFGIRTNYTLWAWGNNNLGYLGTGNTVYRSSPLQVNSSSSYNQVVASSQHSAAITTDYQLHTWGFNNAGQLGINTIVSSVNPVSTVAGGSWTQVAVGFYDTWAIKLDGTLWGWGDNSVGQVGDGTIINRSSPVQVSGGTSTASWTLITATGTTPAAKKLNDDSLYIWGGGPIGDGTSVNRSSPVQVIVPGSYFNSVMSPTPVSTSSWSQISAGATHSTAIDTSGRLFTWGLNSAGQLGYASGFTIYSGNGVTGFLRSDGSLFIAGYGGYGALGDGTTINRSSPVQVGTSLYTNIVFDINNNMAIRNDGKLFTWGRNFVGQLGDGTTITRSSPVQIGSSSWSFISTNEDQVSTSYGVTLGITKDAKLWAWGFNAFNQFGSSDYTSGIKLSSPVQIGTSSWTQVIAGFDFTLGLKADSTLWAWGSNIYGQLGVTVVDPTNSWAQISSQSSSHAVALRSDGTVWSWGLNTSGQLGDNSTISRSVPVQILSGSWTSISAGISHSLAVRSDSTLWAWGNNTSGQLGDLTTVSRSSPIQVATAYNYYSTYIGGTSSYLNNDGNALTQLGFGTAAFTMEFWVKLPTVASSGFLSCEFSSTSRTSIYYNATTGNLEYFSNLPNSILISTKVDLVSNTWYHIAYSRTGGTGRLFLNGNQVGSVADTYNLGASNHVYIGYVPSGTINWLTGYLSNVRIVNGVGVYTGNFTVPTGNLTVTQSAGTNISAITAGQTVLLTCQGSTYIDASNTITLRSLGTTAIDPYNVPFTQSILNAKSFTQVSGGILQTIGLLSNNTIWVWGGNAAYSLGDGTTVNRSSPVQLGTGFTQYNYSILFNGTNQSLSVAASDTMTFGTGDFTVDGWFYITESKTHQIMDGSGFGPFGFRITPTLITAFQASGADASFTYTTPLNQWTHIAFVRSLGILTLYVNGSPIGNTSAFSSTSFDTNSANVLIGKNVSNFDFVKGYIGSLRMTLWALYLGQFHPESVLSVATDTVLLIGQASTLVDSSRFGRTVTNVNSATIENFSPSPYSNSWVQVDTGNQAMAALTSDGRMFGWGNTTTNQLMSKTNVVWKTVDQGSGIRADGRLFMWGHNFTGALGDGTVISKSSPIQIGTGSNWKMITTGRGQKNNVTAGYTLAIKNDGTLWAWGSNNTGQLGLGDTVLRSSPVQIPGSWMSVDASSSVWEHVLAIRSDGLLFAWGYNAGGTLGDGTTVTRSSPVQIGTSSWIVVSAGYQVAAAVRSDNTLWVWGSNSNGNIGDNTTVSKSSPVQVAGTWRTVSIGNLAGYGIKSDYTLWGWGYNVGGNVGDNTITMRSSPVQVGIGSSWLMVSGSGEAGSGAGGFALAIRTDYTLWGWGTAALGQLGQNDVVNRSSPVQISGNVIDPTGAIGGSDVQRSFVYVKAGGTASFASDTDGQLWSWGDNGANATYGQEGILGNGTTISKSSPVQVGSWNEQAIRSPVQVGIGMAFNKFNMGSDSALAIKTDGTLWGWGANNNFQIGKAYSWTNILGMTSSGFMLRDDGSLMLRGANNFGQLGDNTTVNKSSPIQLSAGSNKKWITGAAGLNTVYMIKDDASLWAWGSATDGTLGDNSTINHRSSPVQLAGIWSAVAGVSSSAYGIKTDGTLWSWGLNNVGQLGLGDTVSRSSPTQIAGSWSNIWSNDTGANPNVIAQTTGGLIYVWGSNTAGQLGLNDTVSRSSPVQLASGLPNFVKFGTVGAATMYINTLGQLYAWGTNLAGQLGTGDTIARSSPVQIHTGFSYLSVATAWQTTAAIRSDGTLWTWGSGTGGLLGNNTTVNRSSPVQIATTNKFSDIRAGMSTFYAVSTTDATARLHAWGVNTSGELGDNTTVNRSSPVQVVSSSTAMVYSLSSPSVVASGSWTQIVANKGINTAFTGVHAAAIRSDGTLWVWGSNTAGGLGFNNTTPYATPTQFGSATNWSGISSSDGALYTLNSLGQLYGAGYNAQGQIGDNTTVNRSSPVQITPRTQMNPIQIAGSWSQIGLAGYGQHAVGITTDGRLFAWGRNDYGQLGTGDTLGRSSPTQVSTGESFISVASGNIPSLGVGNTGAITSDGRLFTWGYNALGTLATVDVITRSSPVQVGFGLIWSRVYNTGGYTMFGITDIGKIYGWGGNDFGVLGLNDTVYRSSPVQINTVQGLQQVSSPTQVGTSANWYRVSAGDLTTGARNTSGRLFAWGDNSTGFAGDGTTQSRSSPVQVSGLSYSLLSAGGTQLLAVVDNDPYLGKRLVTSGLNAGGQQGINTVANSSFQVAVSTTVASNASSPVQVGSSTANYRSSPVQVGSSSWIAVAAGENHSLGTTSSGSLFGWGYNVNGQVGDSTTINKSSPVQISALTTWVDVEAGYNHSVVEKSDGSVYTFGNNNDGQLGDGT